MVMNRRNFLRAAAGGTLAATCVAPVEAREGKPMPESAVGLLFDGTLCIGCRACMSACKAMSCRRASSGQAYWGVDGMAAATMAAADSMSASAGNMGRREGGADTRASASGRAGHRAGLGRPV